MKSVVAIVVVIVVALWGYRQWYVDTHCTMILGTQVCATGTPAPPPAAPDPAQSAGAEPAHLSTLPRGVTKGSMAGTYWVSCWLAQCTGLAGAGPNGTTCGKVVHRKQFCKP